MSESPRAIDRGTLEWLQEKLETRFQQDLQRIRPDGSEGDAVEIGKTLGGIQKVIILIRECLAALGDQEGIPVVDFRTQILGLALPAEIGLFWNDNCATDRKDLKISKADMKEYHLQAGLAAIEVAAYRMRREEDTESQFLGQRFFRKMFQEREKSTLQSIDFAETGTLATLRKKVTCAFGEEYAPIVHLLLHCMHGNLSLLARIIDIQTEMYIQEKPNPHFFDHVQAFIGVFGDVTQYLITNSDRGAEIRERSIKILPRIFQDTRLLQFRAMHPNMSPNLFDVLTDLLNVSSKQNPWFCGDLHDTIFDGRKIGELVTPEIPREILGPVLVQLNDYVYLELLEERDSILRHHNQVTRTHDAETTKLEARVDDLIARYHLQISPSDSLREKIQALRDISPHSGSHPRVVSVAKGSRAVPLDAMLRIIHPKTIVRNPIIQRKFLEFLKHIRKADDLRSSTIETPLLILGRSIQEILYRNDPYLDWPLETVKEEQSIRELLMALGKAIFPDEQILHGPQYDPDRPDATKGEPLLAMVGTPDPGKLERLRRNFTAAKVMPEEIAWLMGVSEVLSREKSFSELSRYTCRQLARYYRASPNKKSPSAYQFYLHHSASGLLAHFMSEFFPNMEEMLTLFSNHEYDGITRAFLRSSNGSRILEADQQLWLPGDVEFPGHTLESLCTPERKNPGLQVFYLNIREESRSKKPEELFGELEQHIEAATGKKTQATNVIVLLSSVSRLGDTPFSVGDKDGVHYLRQFVALLKKSHSDIPVIIDECQAFGRRPPISLRDIPADIILGSGQKAGMVGPIGWMGVRNEFLEKLVRLRGDDGYKYQAPSLGSQYVPGLGLMVQQLHSPHSIFDNSHNVGALKDWREDQILAAHMSECTAYTLEKAKEYGETFLTQYNARLHPELRGKSERYLQDLFSCDVLYPIHRSFQDYTGIVTLTWRNVKGIGLEGVLASKGFKVMHCGNRQRALRIDFHRWHRLRDIDALFDALQEAHIEIHERETAKQQATQGRDGNPLRYVPFVEWAEN